jgi:Flp pilus assembly protein TadD
MRVESIPRNHALASRPHPRPADQALASLNQGVHAYAMGDLAAAQRHLHRATALNLCDSEPWYWLGRIQEDLSEPLRAAQCYYLCRNSRQWGSAQDALRRLGQLGQR